MNLKELMEPQNPIWLKIAKWLVTISSVLILVFAFIYGVIAIANDFPIGILFWFAGGVLAFFNQLTGMLILGLLSNVQEIKFNTSINSSNFDDYNNQF